MPETSRNWAVRSLSATALIPIAVWLSWWGGTFLTIAVAAVAVLCILELRRLSIAAGWGFALIPSLFIVAVLVIQPHLHDPHRPTVVLTAAIVVTLTLVIRLITRLKRESTVAWLAGVAGALYIGGLASLLVGLRGFSEGFLWILLAFVGTWAYDTGAYMGGTAFGKHPFAARISPKKTWEGIAAGMAAVLIGIIGFTRLLPIETWHVPIVAALVACTAQAGDLLESALKRAAGVKNSSALIPGHGGILDRVDSLLMVIPVIFLYASLIGESGHVD